MKIEIIGILILLIICSVFAGLEKEAFIYQEVPISASYIVVRDIDEEGNVVGQFLQDNELFGFYYSGKDVFTLSNANIFAVNGDKTSGTKDNRALFWNPYSSNPIRLLEQVGNADIAMDFTEQITVGQTIIGSFLKAVIWDEKGQFIDYEDFGYNNAAFTAVNEYNEFTGFAGNGVLTSRAFYYDNEDFEILTNSLSTGFAINNLGHIVGHERMEKYIAFYWNKETTNYLEDLGGGAIAFDINEEGFIVGTSKNRNGEWCAVMWDKNFEIINLNELINLNTTLKEANAINNKGYIAGITAENKAFILKPLLPTNMEE